MTQEAHMPMQVLTPEQVIERKARHLPAETRARVLDELRRGSTFETAAWRAGMTRSGLDHYRRTDPAFGDACRVARARHYHAACETVLVWVEAGGTLKAGLAQIGMTRERWLRAMCQRPDMYQRYEAAMSARRSA